MQFAEKFENESDDAYISRMRRQGAWGGHLEIMTWAEITGFKIMVYQENGTVNIIHPETQNNGDSLRIYFTNGNHYDALVPKQSVEGNIQQINNNSITQKPNSPFTFTYIHIC